MARRIVIEWDCPQDCPQRHLYTHDYTHRRVLNPGSYVLIEKVDGEWPAIDVDGHFVVGPLMIQTIAAALAGGER